MGTFAGYLKETDLFHNLSPEHLELVEQICESCVYQPGEFVFHEKSHGKELYLIIQGQIDVLIDPGLVSGDQHLNADPIVIERFWPGQSFGELALVDEGLRSGSAIVRDENTHVLRIPRQQLLDLCESNPMLGYVVMYNLALDLSQKIRNSGLKIREAILKSRQDKE
jgi:CRP/FNR family transcriptional regulator, cyclic AMP receptor protein